MHPNWFNQAAHDDSVQRLVRLLEQSRTGTSCQVSSGAHSFFTALLQRLSGYRVLVLVADGLKTQETLQQDTETWSRLLAHKSGPPPLFYPAWESMPHEGKLPHADVISERLETLLALLELESRPDTSRLLVTNVQALLQRTLPVAELRRRTRWLQTGDQLNPLDLVEWLEDQGYEPEAQVTQKGELSLRGGILDVFPVASRWPVRLDFFGDELESLRFFDPLTQISREEKVECFCLAPAGELGLLRQMLAPQGASRPELSSASKSETALGVTSAQASESSELTAPPHRGSLLEYLPPQTLFIFSQPELIDEQVAEYAVQIPSGDPFFIRWETVLEALDTQGMSRLELSDTLETTADADLPRVSSLEAFRPIADRPLEPPLAEQQRREFFAQIHRWLRQGYHIDVFCNNEGERQRFSEIWSDYGWGAEPGAPVLSPATEPPLGMVVAPLSRGFVFDSAKLVAVTDAEIFGRYKFQRARRLKSPHAAVSKPAWEIDLKAMEEGDYVVHLQYGIGRYRGLQILPETRSRRPGGSPLGAAADHARDQECLVIEYAPSQPGQPPPKLYVPITEAHLVSKYIGANKARPQLNTLTGTRWLKTRAQAEAAVRDLAAELLELQAARATQPGYAFKTDTPWQREFEGAFLFEETPDQLRAIQETKANMEKPRSMDRLICGDVGYGKTEVALRAAFKAVMDGKQAAILVPTTVLAQQHFNTFRERMVDYPIRLELLSRFRKPHEQKRVVQELASGQVDIVIGTHRLIQSDIQFKDLGLVVIDEEQRFGVAHKEKLKLMRKLVDVLTLSATPIPRTLYLALMGARDMSLIETPPQDRLPVETYVVPYNEEVIRNAIQRELNRQGQVFFLHNRVETIETMAERLRALLPRARIIVGHGQMHSRDLEEVMTRFVNGEADVLLSTTIIESGLDIPNANTIIIDRADRFGLSDLYQLRGRVGRYKHQAYAYLLLPRHAEVLSDARKRLSAIKQYSSLGSGFRIAMRDMEIRGAGNLLGHEQSGHIAAVGFDLYCQLLKQSISVLKGEPLPPRLQVAVQLDFLLTNPEAPTVSPAPPPNFKPKPKSRKSPPASVSVPREVMTYFSDDDSETETEDRPVTHASACLPHRYVADAQQRLEIYRQLAETTDMAAGQRLQQELRDRFGPVPESVELLLQIAELKILAQARGITSIETRGPKLMLVRNHDYLMLNGRFPRLTKPTAATRLKEIKGLLLSL